MEITEALAADLSRLTEALDEPTTDVAHTLQQVAADARAAVASYLGLSVLVGAPGDQFDITAMDDAVPASAIGASVRLPLLPARESAPSVVVVLYAAAPGAFVDLVADLSWLTGRDPADYVLDQHLTRPEASNGPSWLSSSSAVNQAIGILIARGRTPEQADDELNARAAGVGGDRAAVARDIVANLDQPG